MSHHFQAQNGPFVQNIFVGKTIINIISMFLLAPFICKIEKKSLEWIQSYDDVPFSIQNGPFVPNENFFSEKPF